MRETTEETGLTLKDPRQIQDAYVSAGGTSEKISIVVGIVDTSAGSGIFGCENEKENIKTRMVSAKDFIDEVKTGVNNDMKTIIAGYWLAEHRDALRAQYTPKTGGAKPPKPSA